MAAVTETSNPAPSSVPLDRPQCRETSRPVIAEMEQAAYSQVRSGPLLPTSRARVLMVDNYDSFTFNLVQYLLELDAAVEVVTSDAVSVADVRALAPTHIVLSPGPGTPDESGICPELCRWVLHDVCVPLLGVCLGHQVLCAALGADVTLAPRVVHGKSSEVVHRAEGLFGGLPSPLRVGRYHSLIVRASTLPSELSPTAWTDDGELMAVGHTARPVFGVQFHPESVLTDHGHALLRNFLNIRVEQTLAWSPRRTP